MEVLRCSDTHSASLCISDGILLKGQKNRRDLHLLDEKSVFLGGTMPALPLLRRHFASQGLLSERAACRLLLEARTVCAQEPNVVMVPARAGHIIVVGDLHGQYYDAMALLEGEGLPCSSKTVIFLGDYVDRGSFSAEILLYLCACKLLYPRNVVMLRGNHESRPMCERDGFARECRAKYSETVLDAATELFSALPLCCVVKNTIFGDCVCMHGGIGPQTPTLEDINEIDRFSETPEDDGPMSDLLWADPIPDVEQCSATITPDDEQSPVTQLSPEAWRSLQFIPNTDRNTSWFYGYAAVISFLQRNNLACIIRGHQAQETGFSEHFGEGKNLTRVLTVFSSPNYCDSYGNLGSYLRVTDKGLQVQQMRAVPHPFVLPDFQDAISFSLPLLTEGVATIIDALTKLIVLEREKGIEVAEEDSIWDQMLQYKVQKLLEKAKKQRAWREEMLSVSVPENLSRFQQMMKKDKEREKKPPVKTAPKMRLTELRHWLSSSK